MRDDEGCAKAGIAAVFNNQRGRAYRQR